MEALNKNPLLPDNAEKEFRLQDAFPTPEFWAHSRYKSEALLKSEIQEILYKGEITKSQLIGILEYLKNLDKETIPKRIIKVKDMIPHSQAATKGIIEFKDSDKREVTNQREYYTEYPMTTFKASSDEEALNRSTAKVLYRESDTKDGTPFIVLRNLKHS